MPFPPTFTDVWSTVTPPDTQLLNQGALDIRNLKLDVMQRMSLLSGAFANRPTPETVNAVWGGVGFGLLYFATDTGQIFQWTGAGPAWTDVTSVFIGIASSLKTTGSPVVVSGAAAPSAGQVLTALSAIAASWQTPVDYRAQDNLAGGYIAFPMNTGGLFYVQWGSVAVVPGLTTGLTFPVAFPNTGVVMVGTTVGGGSAPAPVMQITSASTFQVYNSGGGNITVAFIALGN